jgi:hypothetical protein
MLVHTKLADKVQGEHVSTHQTQSVTFIPVKNYYMEDRGGTVVKVLCYKSEGRWFDSRWCP